MAPPSMARRVLRVLPYVGVIVSLLILAAPSLVDLLDSLRATMHITQMSSTVEALPAKKKEELLQQAQAYNAWLAGAGAGAGDGAGAGAGADVGTPDGTVDGAGAGDGTVASFGLLPYEEQLRTDSTSMMAWLDVPSIDMRLPIYHGTDEPALAAGVGHIQRSSLPVGGPSAHCVLTAHSGMAGSRMFDDIRMLEPGDRFVLWTLGEPLAYEVEGSEVVLPSQTQSLSIERGQDRCTLMTCTPYGVNSHRLLVHARRCEYKPDEIAAAPAHVSSRIVPVLVALGGIAVAVLLCVVLRRWLRGRASKPNCGD